MLERYLATSLARADQHQRAPNRYGAGWPIKDDGSSADRNSESDRANALDATPFLYSIDTTRAMTHRRLGLVMYRRADLPRHITCLLTMACAVSWIMCVPAREGYVALMVCRVQAICLPDADNAGPDTTIAERN